VSFSCHGLSKTFVGPDGSLEALAPFDLEVAEREFVCVVGPSGCGKSTLLRLISGVIDPTEGELRFSRQRSEGRPRTALVFQDHGLFPWLNVRDNIAFGLEAQGVPRRARRDSAEEIAGRVGLRGFLAAYPHQLSGGMRQRVGIARALLSDPDILLMDEPFGALDELSREAMRRELLALWEAERITVLFVTHAVREAVLLSDRVVVLGARPGRVVDEVPVTLPRPRPPDVEDSPAFIEITRRIRRALGAIGETVETDA